MYRSIGCYIYEVAIDEGKTTIQELITNLRGDQLYLFPFIPSTDIICDIFEWLQVHFISPKFMLIGDMYEFVQKIHSTTPWACPIYARPLIKCATFCPSTQNAMDKVSSWCRWKCRWVFVHKSVMQYTQYMYICVIIIILLNVISTTTCVTSCFYFNIPWFAFLQGSLAQVKSIMFMPKSLI